MILKAIVGVIDEDPYNDSTWSGSSKFFFQELRSQGVLAGAVSAEISTSKRRLFQLKNVQRTVDRWKFKYHLDTDCYESMTRQALAEVNKQPDFDVVLQVGAWYDLTRVEGKIHASYHDGNLATLLSSPYGHPKISSRYIRRALEWEKSLYAKLDVIFPMSKWLAQSFHDDFGVPMSKLFPVGAGINLSYIKERTNSSYDDKTILMVGKNFERKGGRYLLDAFAIVRRELPDARLTIVGPELESLPPNVTCLGYIDKSKSDDVERLLNAYASHAVFAMPSLYEPFGIVFAEAMAHKLPCVATATCAMPEIVEDGVNGYVVPPADMKSLADRMIELLSNPDQCARMGENGYQKYLRDYNWTSVVEKINNVLNR